MKQIKTLLKENINLEELEDFTKKARTTHTTNAKNKNVVFKCDVLELRFAKVRDYAEQSELKEVLEILDTAPGDTKLAEFIGIGRDSVFRSRKTFEKGKNLKGGKEAYAYRLHLLTYQAEQLNKLLKEKKI